MTLKKSSPNAVSSMFWRSAKKVCFVPIITFIILISNTITTIYNMMLDRKMGVNIQPGLLGNESGSKLIGFFWSNLNDAPADLIGILLGFAAVLTAVIIFTFNLSKKQCNVIFSLGISRRKIFVSNYLAGLVPFCTAVILAAFFELLSVFCAGYAISGAIIDIALYDVFSFISIYALVYTITAAVFSFSGNFVEASIFTAIMGFYPGMVNTFIAYMKSFFSLGLWNYYGGKWNLLNPYFFFCDFTTSEPFVRDALDEYFFKMSNGNQFYKLNIFDFSGIITDLVIAAIIFALACFMYQRRRNEISGSFGRATGLNEVCGALVGFYAATMELVFLCNHVNHDDGNAWTYLAAILLFAVGYIIFRMIFGNKRLKTLKRALKTIPAYAVAFAIVTTIFSTGIFGLSSKIPDANDVAYITIRTNLTSQSTKSVSDYRTAIYGLADMTCPQNNNIYGGINMLFGGSSAYEYVFPALEVTVTDSDGINDIIKIHEKYIRDGKIKNDASNAFGANVQIKYTLTNGDSMVRYYTETSEENIKRLLKLNDYESFKAKINEEFDYGDFSVVNEVYAYSKKLKECHYLGLSTSEFKEALCKDLKAQSSDTEFFHKPEDEIGVISFGHTVQTLLGDYYYSDYPEGTDETGAYTNKYGAIEVGDRVDVTASVTNNDAKTYLITKDMVNTIKYLTDKGFMKYFDSEITANDVKSVKLATKSQISGASNSNMLPIFGAGYSYADEVREFMESGYLVHYFEEHVNNEITNKSTIQKILDNSLLYGFCGNNDRIAEVTYNDGSIATYCISSEVYDSLMK